MRLFFFLLLLINLATFGQKAYELKPDAQGYLIIDNKNAVYKPGDTIKLRGSFKAVAVYNLSGDATKPIYITNAAGQTTIIGDSSWSGGSWGHGLAVRNSHYLDVYGSSQSAFKIIGSNSTAKDGNGYPVKTAYFDLCFVEGTDNVKAHDIGIRHGGVGLLVKTDNGTGTLYNFEFYNLDIYNTYNEAVYIGNTSTAPARKLNTVKVHHNYIHDIGNDGIQIASSDNVEVYNNEVTNWGMKKEYSHSGGILIGGLIIGFNVHDNHVHDGFGNMLQVFAQGGGQSLVKNNLFVNNMLDGAIFRGTNNLTVQFINNTVAFAGENLLRVSAGKVELSKNILAGPLGGNYTGTIYLKNYLYTENGGVFVDADNIKVAKGTDVVYAGYGYNAPIVNPPTPPVPVKKTLAIVNVGGYAFTLYEDGSTNAVKNP